MSSSPFLRALMTAVCKAAVKGKHSTTWRRDFLYSAKIAPADCDIYSERSGSACTHSAFCFTEQMITPTVEWTRPSSRGDCLYYSSTLTQTLSDSCKHFMHFRRWSSPSISLQVSAASSFTPPTSSRLLFLPPPNETMRCIFLYIFFSISHWRWFNCGYFLSCVYTNVLSNIIQDVIKSFPHRPDEAD